MFGVILWSDPNKEKAVIWCEDHGQLAFYNDHSEAVLPYAYDVGDMVQFNVTQTDGLRYATQLALVSVQEYPNLVNTLKTGSSPKTGLDTQPQEINTRHGDGRVLQFTRKNTRDHLQLVAQ